MQPHGKTASPRAAAAEQLLATRDVRATNVEAWPDPALLSRLGELADSGELRVPVQRTFSLEEATDGLDAFQREHMHGKFAISVAAVYVTFHCQPFRICQKGELPRIEDAGSSERDCLVNPKRLHSGILRVGKTGRKAPLSPLRVTQNT